MLSGNLEVSQLMLARLSLRISASVPLFNTFAPSFPVLLLRQAQNIYPSTPLLRQIILHVKPHAPGDIAHKLRPDIHPPLGLRLQHISTR